MGRIRSRRKSPLNLIPVLETHQARANASTTEIAVAHRETRTEFTMPFVTSSLEKILPMSMSFKPASNCISGYITAARKKQQTRSFTPPVLKVFPLVTLSLLSVSSLVCGKLHKGIYFYFKIVYYKGFYIAVRGGV